MLQDKLGLGAEPFTDNTPWGQGLEKLKYLERKFSKMEIKGEAHGAVRVVGNLDE